MSFCNLSLSTFNTSLYVCYSKIRTVTWNGIYKSLVQLIYDVLFQNNYRGRFAETSTRTVILSSTNNQGKRNQIKREVKENKKIPQPGAEPEMLLGWGTTPYHNFGWDYDPFLIFSL